MSSSRGPKRQRSSDIARPDPPPPPPPSLVRLIQKDAKVLAYFQALQANLDFDVKKWKSRARALEQELETLHSETKTHRRTLPSDNQQTGTCTDKFLASTSRELPPTPTLQQQQGDSSLGVSTSNPKEKSGKTPNDSDFEFSSASSSEDDECNKERDQHDSPLATDKRHPRQTSFGIHKKNTSLNLSSSSDEEEDLPEFPDSRSIQQTTENLVQRKEIPPDVKRALLHLATVSTIMKELGIPLVDKETVPSATRTSPITITEDQESHVPPCIENDPSQSQNILHRRPDRDIVVDVLQFIKTLSRIRHVSDPTNAQMQHSYYYPFMTNDYLLCFMPLDHSPTHKPDQSSIPPPFVEHPAISGVQKLIQSLCYMDIFCPVLDSLKPFTNGITESTLVQESTDDVLEQDSFSQQRLLLEMQGRQSLISCLLDSLGGEIMETWAIADRTTRLITKATHWNLGVQAPHMNLESDDDDDDDDDDDQGSAAISITPETTEAATIPFNSKNFLRLAALAERCIMAKMVTSLCLFRCDYHKAFQLLYRYILSTTPSLQLEEHPNLPPVLSFCVLDAILTSSPPRTPTTATRTSSGYWLEDCDMGASQSLQTALSLVLQATAQIYNERNSNNMDDRITEISRVELAACSRIIRCKLFSRIRIAKDSLINMTGTIAVAMNSSLTDDYGGGQETVAATCLVLVLYGNATEVDEKFDVALNNIKMAWNKTMATAYGEILLACASAKKQLEIRRLDDYRRVVNTPMLLEPNHTGQRQIQSYSKDFVDWMVTRELEETTMSVVNVAFRCCQVTLDGESAFRLVEWVTKQLPSLPNIPKSTILPILDTIESMSHVLTIRLINLNRRPDRFAAFISQCLNERINIVRGVTNLNPMSETANPGLSSSNSLFFGDHAVDGQGKPAQVERRLVSLSGGSQVHLNRLVETHWVPNELKPFDSEAPDSDRKVLISPSEKACAISHISCWKGVERSLSVLDETASTCSILLNPLGMRQRFVVSGYARAKSLFGTEMEPVPVCVILEDDAILVDRFSDRLDNLLEELPRDFHFCSLGYSRPKTAPLVPYSSEISIPTSIWYLTGYILSLEGAKYLLSKLPVRGPVDSWIGLIMFHNNWDNVYGQALGVGVSSKPPQDPSLSKDILRKILRFRAFAATVPLCTQKVGNLAIVPATGRNWRHRDTDIVYSGNSLS